MGDDWHEFFAEQEFLYDWTEDRELEALAKRYLSAVLTGQDEVVLKLGVLELDALAGIRSRLLDALDGPFASHEPRAAFCLDDGVQVVDLRLKTRWGSSAHVRVVFTDDLDKVQSLAIVAPGDSAEAPA